MEEFFDEVDVSQDHATATIALELKLVERIPECPGEMVRREVKKHEIALERARKVLTPH